MDSIGNAAPGSDHNKNDLKKACDLFTAGRYAAALPLLSKLESAGSPYAAIYLGNMFARGLGVAADTERALAYFRSASDAGTPLGSFYVGALLEKLGRLQESVPFYRSAAKGGDLPAAYALSRLGRTGNAQLSDSETAMYFQQALEGGHVFAKRDLAVSMLRGRHGLLGYLKGIPLFIATIFTAVRLSSKDPISGKLH